MPHEAGVMSVIPAVLLVVLSFGVLVIREKTTEFPLKVFGLVAAVLLWISAALALGTGWAGPPCGPGRVADPGRMEQRRLHGWHEKNPGLLPESGLANGQPSCVEQMHEAWPAPDKPLKKEGDKK